MNSLKSFEEIPIEPYTVKMKAQCRGDNCTNCLKACIYDAISVRNDRVVIDDSKCTGCGLCVSLCKREVLYLDW